ncbi:hypothetical protein BCR33DRAFT_718777 [Rhizoclosmatium globosum]|uniref:Uncharacterized protein n=1 Tax=Rhizoclosmatium globosum TaxID=329046 RepID=A0A1Y2C3K3_9FUNG|nr:hypothetical protein BCR33DRAFT_718777 [Rhizoclosmatium globosum]|eukprot:ORY41620.1 hypothetical protein BCR33DRAFT_718777 [Rhizoclosmatium globosum]
MDTSTFVALPKELANHIRSVFTPIFILLGILLTIPGAKLYYWSCFLITFNVFTCSCYLRLQSRYDLLWVPCFYIGLIAVKLFQPYDLFFSCHTYINAFITATAIFIDKNPKWRIHPTVIVSTAIIGQEHDSITAMSLANLLMQVIVQKTSPFWSMSHPRSILGFRLCVPSYQLCCI